MGRPNMIPWRNFWKKKAEKAFVNMNDLRSVYGK